MRTWPILFLALLWATTSAGAMSVRPLSPIRAGNLTSDGKLPPKLRSHPDVRGRKGNPNIRDVPACKHKDIHSSPPGEYYPGGKYNKRADELVEEYREAGKLDADGINEIRQQLIDEFDL